MRGEAGCAGNLAARENWVRWKTGCTGKLVALQNWLRWKTGCAGKLVVLANRLRRETGCAGKLVAQGNLFLVTLAKIFVIILVVKQITYNAKVSDITIL